MIWPFRRKRKNGVKESSHEAREQIRTLLRQQPEINAIVSDLAERRRQNNFRRMFEEALRG